MTVHGDALPDQDIRNACFVADGRRIHYRRAGSGEDVVVCLHGFPQTGRAWERVTMPLADQFTVIAPDLRGAGESDRPATGYDKKTLAGDIRALVASLGYARIHLVGHDIGAAVVYAYAAQWPGEVARLVLIEMLLPGFGLEAPYAVRKPGELAWMPFFMAQDLPKWGSSALLMHEAATRVDRSKARHAASTRLRRRS